MADNIDSSDTEDLFASPSQRTAARTPHQQPERTKTPTNQSTRFDAEEVREAALRRELEGVRNINEVIEGVIGTLERAKGNMGTVSRTVENASTLLNTWTRILSQTEHNQRLILNPNWKGATDDLADMENETIQDGGASAEGPIESWYEGRTR
ncbi:DASH complex subunit Duo1-domain-containing protein [Lasiosphaeris hirsuta]|uniref:DASH complex subunit DUO1 n=1 Tax=Lasiosphaeris hirsuta TaxID=260670 RepID=A0AA40A1B1_9PEZI|nr:DASH complex subunit Duo1-domain-containing protein [Lasiosphaeris hirsuta]